MAMNRKSMPVVGLDDIINTMYQTGKDIKRNTKKLRLED